MSWWSCSSQWSFLVAVDLLLILLPHFFLISLFVSPGNRKWPRPRPAIFLLYLFCSFRLGGKKTITTEWIKHGAEKDLLHLPRTGSQGWEVQGWCVKGARWAEGAGKWSWALQTSSGWSTYLRKLVKRPLWEQSWMWFIRSHRLCLSAGCDVLCIGKHGRRGGVALKARNTHSLLTQVVERDSFNNHNSELIH